MTVFRKQKVLFRLDATYCNSRAMAKIVKRNTPKPLDFPKIVPGVRRRSWNPQNWEKIRARLTEHSGDSQVYTVW